MTRREYYGENADAEFEKAIEYYAKENTMCRENCPLCAELGCKSAWMETELDENGDPCGSSLQDVINEMKEASCGKNVYDEGMKVIVGCETFLSWLSTIQKVYKHNLEISSLKQSWGGKASK